MRGRAHGRARGSWACASGVVLRCIRVLGRTTLVHVFVDRVHACTVPVPVPVRVCVLMCVCARCVAAGGALGERGACGCAEPGGEVAKADAYRNLGTILAFTFRNGACGAGCARRAPARPAHHTYTAHTVHSQARRARDTRESHKTHMRRYFTALHSRV